MKWFKDEDFVRGNIPMTKFEVRAVTMAVLDIEEGDVLLDVGAGTGSISIQAAALGAEVTAIEREVEGAELITKNAEKLCVKVNVINGSAPEDINKVDGFNKVFVGGSGGNLRDIIKAADSKLKANGLIVGNFVTPDNMVTFKNCLKEFGYTEIEARLIQTANMDKIGLLKGQNPVFIVKGRKR
ncbi:SAM-dependent methlyltransferase [Fervidicella metallireducens AeB]|uniref:SAM-dependent methlyltransferase n=1 Tax=Fervidicella metallireducens AeB TaxID=1403537 RepID=A0A017RX14_9CLOT|nr:precorrin-6Y C5,15-methyltransferase (decarboxylating) subunit CbiT [Fervidicella metallireducens]EYE89227.1 SAM-dependent methlyltransferase [Fervidicella metallireducens AeB]